MYWMGASHWTTTGWGAPVLHCACWLSPWEFPLTFIQTHRENVQNGGLSLDHLRLEVPLRHAHQSPHANFLSHSLKPPRENLQGGPSSDHLWLGVPMRCAAHISFPHENFLSHSLKHTRKMYRTAPHWPSLVRGALAPCSSRPVVRAKSMRCSRKSRWTHRVACTLLSTPPEPPASKSLQQCTLRDTGRPKHQGFPSAVTQQSDSFFTAYHHCLITPNCRHSPFKNVRARMYASLNQKCQNVCGSVKCTPKCQMCANETRSVSKCVQNKA